MCRIQYGDADIIIAGGSSAPPHRRHGGLQPGEGCRSATMILRAPASEGRDGFVMGDGGGAVVLGNRTRRGARRTYADASDLE
jgi:3-oxoacyl-(acyl-carrier-protein) synthase